MVELVAAAIFGSLFLYQLVTGCSNVPGIDITHKGILWIILYPKWPIISIYFFHSFFMCMLLVVALFEQQQQALRVGFAIVIGGTCLLLASALPVLQPVPLFDHFPGNGFLLSPIVEQVLKVGVGLLLGAILGRLLALIVSAAHPSILTFAFGLAGIVLGWQALLQVTLVFALLLLFGKSIRFMPLLRYPTSTLLLAVFVHHPFWQAIAKLW